MIDADLTLRISEPNDPEGELERMRQLVAVAEASTGLRFSIVWFREPTSEITITTSGTEVSDHERNILAAFARPALDQRAAHAMGTLEGIVEVLRAIYGDKREEWPAKWRKRTETLSNDVGKASTASAHMVRVAMTAFDMSVFKHGDAHIVSRPDNAVVSNDR